MKKLIYSLSIVGSLLFSAIILSAQTIGTCDPNTSSPIQCGYYQEGYQDGRSDAQNNRENDYRHFRNKLDSNRYEANYKTGYDEGYASIRPFSRWNRDQRNSYDNGFRDGESDKRRLISRLPERYEGQYNRTFETFYKQGYFDGYDGRARTYDTAISDPGNNQNPTFPDSGVTPTGSLSWSGRVDDRVEITIQGADVRNRDASGSGFTQGIQQMNGVLPRRDSVVSVNKISGRGTVNVIQQPSRINGYTAVIQVIDNKRGPEDYRLDISWISTAPVEEPYQSGRVYWKGKVDITGQLVISGNNLEARNVSGNGILTYNKTLTGLLARRNGTVNIRKIKGRGNVSIVQQPLMDNDGVAIVQIDDTDRGSGDYEIEITW